MSAPLASTRPTVAVKSVCLPSLRTSSLPITMVLSRAFSVVAIYVTKGGLRGISWVAVFKGILMLTVGGVCVVLVIHKQYGSLSEMFRQIAERSPESLTLPGTVLGTLGYMSPEQLAGHYVDEKTDIFSAGVVAVEAVTGRHPFAGPSSTAMVAAILQKPFRLEGDSEEVRRLDAIFRRCLAKSRADRYPSIAHFRRALIPALRVCPPFPAAPRSVWERETIADDTRKGR